MRKTLKIAPLALLLLLAACGTDPDPGGDAPAETAEADAAAVEIAMFRFDPETIRVAPGEEITWTNTDEILHTVTAGRHDAPDRETFDADLDGPSTTYSLTLDEPGTYTYFCDRHHFMRGEIIIG